MARKSINQGVSQAMFLGSHANTMDAKGRVNIPSAFRDVLHSIYDDGRIIITRDLLEAQGL